ncbi:MAG TPA: hypothetical protein VGQ83_28835 [Polyangia bacterium]|jgi:hypothetical protein
MRSYLSSVIVALALLAGAQPASATTGTCYDTAWSQCSYYDSCLGWRYYDCYPQVFTNPHACPETPTPELEKVYLSYNGSTGDYGYEWCTSKAGYNAAAEVSVYRGAYNNAIGTPWGAHPIYQCTRSVYFNGYWKTDDYASTSPYCQGGTYTGQAMGYLLDGPSDPGGNYMLYLCYIPTQVQAGGGTWWEFRVSTSCPGGYVYEYLGYARQNAAVSEGTVAGNTCDAAHCYGECGADCDGVFGKHYVTDACYAHDKCVCENGGNIWAIQCMGDFVLAAISYVWAAATELIESIIGAIWNGIKHVLHALCFWC